MNGPERDPHPPRAPITALDVSVYAVPTDAPEADGTLAWDHTTAVVVEAHGGGQVGLGYSYCAAAAGRLIRDVFCREVVGRDAFAPGAAAAAMGRALRNLGRPGLGAMALSAVDIALWDLKARLLGISLVDLLGAVRDAVPVYGSGGFTSYPPPRLVDQLVGFTRQGIRRVKMKVGSAPSADMARVRLARTAVGPEVGLMVDANGAYDRKQALALAAGFAALGVCWFEEPVSSDDLDGLRLLRDRAPAGMEIAAGEYASGPLELRRLLEAGAVDVLQVDGTRCGGVSGLLVADALCAAHCVPLSAHTAPSLHGAVMCALQRARDVEYFHDHARVEALLFDGALAPRGGRLWPERRAPGLGLSLRRADARRFAVGP